MGGPGSTAPGPHGTVQFQVVKSVQFEVGIDTFRRMTAGGTKPGGAFPLHWAMRVSRSMMISCQAECRRGSASVPGQAARARRPVTSRQRGRSARRTRRVDRPSTRDTLGRNDGRVLLSHSAPAPLGGSPERESGARPVAAVAVTADGDEGSQGCPTSWSWYR